MRTSCVAILSAAVACVLPESLLAEAVSATVIENDALKAGVVSPDGKVEYSEKFVNEGAHFPVHMDGSGGFALVLTRADAADE